MTEQDYSDALLPEGRAVLGVPLLPLCIGHAVLLHRLRSPVVSSLSLHPMRGEGRGEGTFPQLGDLLLALEICRREPMQLPSRTRMKWLGLRCLRLTELGRLRLENAFLQGVLDFREYWRAALAQWPEIIHNPDAKDLGVPTLAALHAGLLTRFGMSDAEAMQTPISKAVHLLCVDSALKGDLKLKTAEHTAMAAAHADLTARLAAGEQLEDLMAEATARATATPEGARVNNPPSTAQLAALALSKARVTTPQLSTDR